jgi:signal transduction histidine kinase
MGARLTGLDRNRLRLWLALFFVALAVPTAVLIHQAYGQLKWEAFHQHQVLAEELAARIDARYAQLIDAEEARSFSDYAFLVVAGDPAAGFVQRSPLSAYPLQSGLPGLIGYFQVDTQGGFSTPLLPQTGVAADDFGIGAAELDQRRALAARLRRILSDNRLVHSGAVAAARPPGGVRADAGRYPAEEESVTSPLEDTPPKSSPLRKSLARDEAADTGQADSAAPQAAFDRLNAPAPARQAESKQRLAGKLGRVEDLKLDYRYQAASPEATQDQLAAGRSTLAEKRARTERSAVPEAQLPSSAPAQAQDAPLKSELDIRIFESEIDPFEFSLLDSGHFVLFRKVWRDGERYIQGLLLEQQVFLDAVIRDAFRDTALAGMSDLIVAYRGEVFSALPGQAARAPLASAAQLRGALLHQTRLSAPLSDMQLIFSVTRLPPGPGARVLGWVTVVLVLVLCGGFYLMYRLGAGQIALARQQQDFVSAVSHELKTPLTSIRMYGEMLREGWAPEDKKQGYYAFIHDESERLSRLIGNVLQLARMNRNEVKVDVKAVSVSALIDGVRSPVSSQIERAGFALRVNCDAAAGQAVIEVDADAFTQILINLVDNAVKFAAGADSRIIDIGCRQQRDGSVVFSVRDYGPGVPRDQMKKIFRLFYRSENELTRETVGTGIGLALVRQLTEAMGGQVDVVNRAPGAEFRVVFPAAGPRAETCGS